MKCPHCNKGIAEIFRSKTTGAMFICRNSGNEDVFIAPAGFGLRKYRGCVEYGDGEGDKFTRIACGNLMYDKGACQQIYKDYPAESEAWLVSPIKGGYQWEHVDPLITFSD